MVKNKIVLGLLFVMGASISYADDPVWTDVNVSLDQEVLGNRAFTKSLNDLNQNVKYTHGNQLVIKNTANEAMQLATTAISDANKIKDVVNKASTTANQANDTAETAITTVRQVRDVADNALDVANQAENVANQAKNVANTTKDVADNALTIAKDTKHLANQVKESVYDLDDRAVNAEILSKKNEDDIKKLVANKFIEYAGVIDHYDRILTGTKMDDGSGQYNFDIEDRTFNDGTNRPHYHYIRVTLKNFSSSDHMFVASASLYNPASATYFARVVNATNNSFDIVPYFTKPNIGLSLNVATMISDETEGYDNLKYSFKVEVYPKKSN